MRKYGLRILAAGLLAGAVLYAEALRADEAVFPGDVEYDIYYQVASFEVDLLERYKIREIVAMGEREYLVVYSQSGGLGSRDKKGFIPLDAVKALLPSNASKPKRVFAQGR